MNGRVLRCFAAWIGIALAVGAQTLRPPSVPLVVVDPYFSVWSPADKLADAPTEHWSGARQPINAVLRVDGKAYRLLGTEPADAPALPQTGPDYTLAYVLGGLCLVSAVTAVTLNVRKKKQKKQDA